MKMENIKVFKYTYRKMLIYFKYLINFVRYCATIEINKRIDFIKEVQKNFA